MLCFGDIHSWTGFALLTVGLLCFACYLIKSQMHKMTWTVLKIVVP